MVRSAAAVRREMRRGLSSLVSIATVAPFFGFFGTVVGIMGSFRTVGSSKSATLADVANWISESLAPTLLGLLVAILAYGSYRYLDSRSQRFDVETTCAASDLLN